MTQSDWIPVTGKLLVKKLHPDARTPEVAYPREDLGYDIFASEDTFIEEGQPTLVKTGIAACYVLEGTVRPFGLQIEDRSGNAAKHGLHCLAGQIDAGYRGEIGVVMMLLGPVKESHPKDATFLIRRWGYLVKAGDKIAQMIPREVLTDTVEVVDELPPANRRSNGFGSTGR